MKHVRSLVVLATLCCIGPPTLAQPKPPPAEEPGWAKGRPKTDTAMRMAPVPAFPIPTAWPGGARWRSSTSACSVTVRTWAVASRCHA